MQPRMKNPVMVIPEAMQALLALGKSAERAGVPKHTLYLVEIRASQINGCGLCLDMHTHEAKRDGESDERIFSVAAWREAPWFSGAERVALKLTEALTRLADKEDAVPDALWKEATEHYDEKALSALLIAIATINVWNRLNVPTRQLAGSFRG